MLNLIGVHECKLDAKGRVAIPASLKKQLMPLLDQGFVLKRSVFQNCLELFPMQEWEKTMTRVNKLNRFVKKNNDFIRLYTAGVKLLEVDSSSRVNIPKDLMVYADLKTEIVLSSAVGMIEIWDRPTYEKSLQSMVGDFGQLAEDVMGSLNESDGLS